MQRLVAMMVLGAILWLFVIPTALLLLRFMVDGRNHLLGRQTYRRDRFGRTGDYGPNATDPSDFPELGP